MTKVYAIQYILPRYFGISHPFDRVIPSFKLETLNCAKSGPNIWCASDMVVHWAWWMPGRAFYIVTLTIS